MDNLNLSDKIIFDGGDMAGKTTIISILRNLGFDIEDRHPEYICKYMLTDYTHENRVSHLKTNLKSVLSNNLVIFLYNDDDVLIEKRINERKQDGTLSKFDEDAVLYNHMYKDSGEEIVKDKEIRNFYVYNTSSKFLFENIYNLIQIFTEYGIYSKKLNYEEGNVNKKDIELNKILFESKIGNINIDKNKKFKDYVKIALSNEVFTELPLVSNIVSSHRKLIISKKEFTEYDFLKPLKETLNDFEANKLCPCRFCSQFIDKSPELNEAGNIIIRDYNHFVLGVGLGQICERYLILTPKRHINSFAFLNEVEKEEFKDILTQITDFNKKTFNAETSFMEHGAKLLNNFSKSVEHAHLHVVSHLLNDFEEDFRKIEFEDIFKLQGMYNLYMDKDRILINETNTKISQYWRKKIADMNGREWDWRKTNEKRQDLEKIKNLYLNF